MAGFGHSDPVGTSDLNRILAEHDGRLVHKWTHYADLYDRHFAPYRGKPVGVLEIGVAKGGSLEMWRKYFGSDATLFGVDIDPACQERVDPPNQVRIGSQADPEFLWGVVKDMNGQVDIIIDDGSHIGRHQWSSFRALWPCLKTGGLYVIEDLHTSYWTAYEGGYSCAKTGTGIVKQLIDDMHEWFHGKGHRLFAYPNELGGIHVYDSIAFIEKVDRPKPAEVVKP